MWRMKYVTVRMSYLFVSYIFTQFKVWEKVFGGQILFTGSKELYSAPAHTNFGSTLKSWQVEPFILIFENIP